MRMTVKEEEKKVIKAKAGPETKKDQEQTKHQ
jgi:hypothetical protein